MSGPYVLATRTWALGALGRLGGVTSINSGRLSDSESGERGVTRVSMECFNSCVVRVLRMLWML